MLNTITIENKKLLSKKSVIFIIIASITIGIMIKHSTKIDQPKKQSVLQPKHTFPMQVKISNLGTSMWYADDPTQKSIQVTANNENELKILQASQEYADKNPNPLITLLVEEKYYTILSRSEYKNHEKKFTPFFMPVPCEELQMNILRNFRLIGFIPYNVMELNFVLALENALKKYFPNNDDVKNFKIYDLLKGKIPTEPQPDLSKPINPNAKY